jgi:hypothetical protein
MVALVMVAFAGCAKDPFAPVPVSGRVTLDGLPAARVTVSFNPRRRGDTLQAGPPSMATTDSEGRFMLQVARPGGRSGAVPGAHLVAIRGLEDYDGVVQEPARNRAPTGGEAPPPIAAEGLPSVRIPPRYHRGDIEFVVPPAGTAAADFELTSG